MLRTHFTFTFLSHGYTCDFLPAMAIQHPQNSFLTKVEGICTFIQVTPTSATCCNSMNILQHCLGICALFQFYNRCNIKRKCCVACANSNIAYVGTALCVKYAAQRNTYDKSSSWTKNLKGFCVLIKCV